MPGIDVIPLAFHVDYWDYLGWKDRFSSPQYSARQRQYSTTVHGGVFTPQLIVDGVRSVVGSDRRGAIGLITDSSAKRKSALELSARENAGGDGPASLTLEISSDAPKFIVERAELVLAVAEDGLVSEVTRGENTGRRLRQEAVVRRLVPLGKIDTGRSVHCSFTLQLDPEWNRQRIRYIAWIQGLDSRRVLAIAELAPARD